MLGEIVEAWSERWDFTYRKDLLVHTEGAAADVEILSGPLRGRFFRLTLEELPVDTGGSPSRIGE